LLLSSQRPPGYWQVIVGKERINESKKRSKKKKKKKKSMYFVIFLILNFFFLAFWKTWIH
jgi:hypothetical protein